MALVGSVFLVVLFSLAKSELCPKQCDCDMLNGLNRAVCADQNIVTVNIGVPREVQDYNLNRNAITELYNYCFKDIGYQSLKILSVSNNLIFWIGIHAFDGLNELVYLDLSYNRLRYISSDAFWDTPILENLDLSGNVFETLKNEPFLMHPKLEVLNLNNCRIKSLTERLFTRLPNLKKLDISDNYMITLKPEVLLPLKKLERLDIGNEYLKCNPEFVDLEKWIISKSILYKKKCKKSTPNMFEKIISIVKTEKKEINVQDVWNISSVNKTKIDTTPLNQEYSVVHLFILGIELGLAIGIVGTYIWLTRLCACKRKLRIERRRRRPCNELRTNLLWKTFPEYETPPMFRRQISLPDRAPSRFGGFTLLRSQTDDNCDNRSESPPPPYKKGRV